MMFFKLEHTVVLVLLLVLAATGSLKLNTTLLVALRQLELEYKNLKTASAELPARTQAQAASSEVQENKHHISSLHNTRG